MAVGGSFSLVTSYFNSMKLNCREFLQKRFDFLILLLSLKLLQKGSISRLKGKEKMLLQIKFKSCTEGERRIGLMRTVCTRMRHSFTSAHIADLRTNPLGKELVDWDTVPIVKPGWPQIQKFGQNQWKHSMRTS